MAALNAPSRADNGTKLERGAVYVATRSESYVLEAANSARSLKDCFGDLHVTLFTDVPQAAARHAAAFDAVSDLPPETPAIAAPLEDWRDTWAVALYHRVRCLAWSPYNRTLQLDTDTLVVKRDIRRVFALLDDANIAMVPCTTDNSFSCRALGEDLFNAGFILYDSSYLVKCLLNAWRLLTAYLFSLATLEPAPLVPPVGHIAEPDLRRRLLLNDQVSLAQLLSPTRNVFGLRCLSLGDEWNRRGGSGGEGRDADAIVHHRDDLKQ